MISFVSDHLHKILRTALFAASIAFFYLGQALVGVSILLPWSYEILHHDFNLIPFQVNFFIENWMPMIASFGLLITGGVFTKIFSGVSLLLESSSIKKKVYQKISEIMRKISPSCWKNWIAPIILPKETISSPAFERHLQRMKSFPPLHEFDASMQRPVSISKSRIDEVLGAQEGQIRIAPSVFTTEVDPLPPLREDQDLQKILTFARNLRGDWIGRKYYLVLCRVASDSRFIQFLESKLGKDALAFNGNKSASNETWLNLVKERIDQAREEASSEEFVVHWVFAQLESFVRQLEGKEASEGSSSYLAKTRSLVYKVIPFLEDSEDRVSKEDAILDFSVGGGKYCNLGKRQAAATALDRFIQPIRMEKIKALPLEKRFLLQFLITFQDFRKQLLDGIHQKATAVFNHGEFASTAQDIHLHEGLKLLTYRYRHPMPEEDKGSISLTSFLFGECLMPFLISAAEEEIERRLPINDQLETFISHLPEAYEGITSFVGNWIWNSSGLEESARDEIFDRLGVSKEKQVFFDLTKSNEERGIAGNEDFTQEVLGLAGKEWSRLFLYLTGVYQFQPAEKAGA